MKDSTKITLTLKQLKKLVKEGRFANKLKPLEEADEWEVDDSQDSYGAHEAMLCKEIEDSVKENLHYLRNALFKPNAHVKVNFDDGEFVISVDQGPVNARDIFDALIDAVEDCPAIEREIRPHIPVENWQFEVISPLGRKVVFWGSEIADRLPS